LRLQAEVLRYVQAEVEEMGVAGGKR